MPDGRVVELLIAPDAAAPMRSVTRVEAVAGLGLAGDRYAGGRGTFSGWPGAGRHVTLVAVEAAAEAGVAPADLRRNVVVAGVDLDRLVGVDFRLGDAVLRGVRRCEPCALLEERTGRPGLRAALEGRAGLRADVVAGGAVAVGDRVATVTPADPGADRMLAG